MGFLGFLKFSLLCIDVVAWPIFALGYPLCASIRAIETNSNYHMRKLVTYWILFSLISLFELVFVGVIERLPFWAYIKLIFVCWLVIPRFNGAYYVYKRLVHACLSVDLHSAVEWLNTPKDEASLKPDTFLAVAERYVKKNGTEALEKLIANKSKNAKPNHEVKASVANSEKMEVAPIIQSKNAKPNHEVKASVANSEKMEVAPIIQSKNAKPNHEVKASVANSEKMEVAPIIQSKNTKPNLVVNEVKISVANSEKMEVAPIIKCKETKIAQKDIKAVGPLEKNAAAAAKSVNHAEANLAETEKKVVAAVEVKEMTMPSAGIEDKLLETQALKKIQKEWTCPVGQVTTTSEATLNFPLEGKKHKATCDELKASTQVATTIQCKEPNIAQKDIKAVEPLEKNAAAAAASVNHPEENISETETKAVAAVEVKEVTMSSAGIEDKLLETPALMKIQKEWTCAVCQVKTTSEETLNCHLGGKKHKAKCDELTATKQGTKNNGSSSLTGNKSDQSNKETRKCVYSDRSNQDWTTKQGAKVQVNRNNEQFKQKNSKNTDARTKQYQLWCSICNVRCSGEIDMAAHVNGRKHLALIEEMINSVGGKQGCDDGAINSKPHCYLCNVSCPGEIDLAAHIKGKKHSSRIQEILGSVGGKQG